MGDDLEVGPITWRDALTLLCGERLGGGITREVFEYAVDPTLVVKRESNSHSYSTRFQNQQEWTLWNDIKHRPEIARWFAPCIEISFAGLWLLQKRTTPITLDEIRRALPRVPVYFTDLKAENWGRLGRRVVCHDYGLSLTTDYPLSSGGMKKAHWK